MSMRSASKTAKLLVIFIALLIPPISTSSQIDNCCFVDRQCNTDEQWVKGYWAYQNNQCGAPSQQRATSSQASTAQSQSQTATSEDIDNCCFVDRQCETDDDWTTGYWAFQNNQCAVPTDSPSQAQPREAASEEVNNCCFTGWQCDTDQEWTSGYWAFQQNQCASQSQWQEQWPQWLQQQSGAQQHQNSNQQRPRQNNNRRAQAPVDRWGGVPPWRWICGGSPCAPNPNPQPTISISIDLTNPKKRLIDDPSQPYVIVDPDLPD